MSFLQINRLYKFIRRLFQLKVLQLMFLIDLLYWSVLFHWYFEANQIIIERFIVHLYLILILVFLCTLVLVVLSIFIQSFSHLFYPALQPSELFQLTFILMASQVLLIGSLIGAIFHCAFYDEIWDQIRCYEVLLFGLVCLIAEIACLGCDAGVAEGVPASHQTHWTLEYLWANPAD